MILVLILKSLINQGSDRFPPRIKCEEIKKELKNDDELMLEFAGHDKIYTMGGTYSTGLGYY